MPFQKLGLSSPLIRNLQTIGYVQPTPIQERAIPVVRSGRDIVATAQTGTGKTAAFLLPVLQGLLERPRGRTGALILTPTRELAQQIHGVFRGLAANTALNCALITGGVPEGPQVRALRAGVDVVVATPGRLVALLKEMPTALASVTTLVLDEADQMFDLGFLPDMKRIIAKLTGRRQTLLFSATMPPEIERLCRSILRDPQTIAVGTVGQTATTVTQAVYPVPTHRKTALLEHLIGQFEEPSVLVFTRTRRGARRLARHLDAGGYEVAELHADCSPSQRLRAMTGFRNRTVKILVATNIAARGLDVRHITHVINFDVPAAPEEYVHRIGRTGRGGDDGDSLVFASPEESDQLARIERKIGKRLPRHKVEGFDYGAPAPQRAPGPKPKKRKPAVAAGGPPKRKPSRGQRQRQR
jgi:ATP-dependent RNA helicase RhlE